MGALKSKFRRSKSASRKSKGENSGSSKKQKRTVNLPESQSARKIVDPRLPFSNYRQIFSIRNAWKAISRTMEENAKETLIRLFNQCPHHKKRFPMVIGIPDEDELRKDEKFEAAAMDFYQIFDDVIASLENVDKALKDIQYGAPATKLTKKMAEDLQGPFIETIRLTLGSDRFTETTEDNYKLLYQFVQNEMCKYLDDDDDDPNVDADADVDTTQVADGEPEVTGGNTVVADADIEVNLCCDEAT